MSYEGLRATATRLITSFGKSITVTRGASGYDPVTGDVIGGNVTMTGVGCFIPVRSASVQDDIKRGDVVCYANKLTGGDPEPGDTVEGYQVVSVVKYSPDLTDAVMYELLCRN